MPNTPDEERMEAAIAEHFAASTEGGTLTGYVLIMKGKRISDIGDDYNKGRTRYVVTSPDHMEYDQVLGLTRFGMLNVENGFSEDDDE